MKFLMITNEERMTLEDISDFFFFFKSLLEDECFLRCFFPLHKLANVSPFGPLKQKGRTGSFAVKLIRIILFLIILLDPVVGQLLAGSCHREVSCF